MRLLLRKILLFLLARKNKSKLLFYHSLCRPVGFLEGKILPFLLARKMKIKKDLKAFFILMAEARGFEPPIRFPAYTRSRRAP